MSDFPDPVFNPGKWIRSITPIINCKNCKNCKMAMHKHCICNHDILARIPLYKQINDLNIIVKDFYTRFITNNSK